MTGMNLPFPLKKNRRLPYEEVFLIDFDSGCHAFCDGGQRTGCDYSFETDGTPEYYPASSYEDVYGSRYNYGGKNVVEYQIPELEYGQFSTTQTGVMERIILPGLQGISASGGGIFGISPGGGTVEIPGFLQGGSTATPATPAFTELTQDFLLSNGAVGKISIPAIGVKNYYLWEGETTAQHEKGAGTFHRHQRLERQCGCLRS